MEKALIALAGLIVGMFITEYFRKRSRIENFSAPIFEKRLTVYEELMKEFLLSCGVIDELREESSFSLEEKNEIAFGNGLKLMQFTEENSLYINEEVSVHIGMLFVGVGDIFDQEETEEERNKAYALFKSKYGETKLLIRLASGITTIDDLITNITKSKPESNFINYFRKAKKEFKQKNPYNN